MGIKKVGPQYRAETKSTAGGVPAHPVEKQVVRQKINESGKRVKIAAPTAGESTASRVSKIVKTKGGDYPVYKKDSDESTSFKSAFAAARKSGAANFKWQGRSYNTKVKEK